PPLQAYVASIAIGKAAPQLRRIELREYLDEVLDDGIDIDDQRRVRIEGRRFDVGGEQSAVAVDDFGPPVRCGQRLRHCQPRLGDLAPEGEPDELSTYGRKRHHHRQRHHERAQCIRRGGLRCVASGFGEAGHRTCPHLPSAWLDEASGPSPGPPARWEPPTGSEPMSTYCSPCAGTIPIARAKGS